MASGNPAAAMKVSEESGIEELLEQHLNRVFIRFRLPCPICHLAASL